MKPPFKTLPTALLLLFIAIITGCHDTNPVDESYIYICETDKQGNKTYYSSELYLFRDSLAIISRLNEPLLACRVIEYTDSTATLSAMAYYPDHNSVEKNELKSPLTISAAWKGRDGIHVKSASPEFKDFQNPVYNYRKRVIYYSKAHILHANIAKSIDKDDCSTNTSRTLADNTATASTETSGTTHKSAKVSATGVPIHPDYSSNSSTGSLNDFHPANPIQFIDYYFGIIAFIFFICLLVLLWIGARTDDYDDYRYNRSVLMGTYSRICLSILLLISVTEIIIFTANPYVLFESDMPLFGCIGRVLFFCAMCIGQSSLTRIMRWKLHAYFGVSFIKGSWALTILSIILTVGLLMSVYGHVTPTGLNPKTILPLLITGIWGLSAIRLVRFAVIRHSAPLSVILFYLIIYPLYIPTAICGLAIGLLGKIAREKPDHEFIKNEDADSPRYITNVYGETTYVTKIGDNYWMDTNGNKYTQSENTYYSQHDGKTYQ